MDMSRLLSVHGHPRRGARAAPMVGERPGRRNRINDGAPSGSAPGESQAARPFLVVGIASSSTRAQSSSTCTTRGPPGGAGSRRCRRGSRTGSAPRARPGAACPGAARPRGQGGVRRRAGGRPRTRRAAGRRRRPGPGRRRGSRTSPRAGRSPAGGRAGSSTCVPMPSIPIPARSRRAGARSAGRSVRTTSWPYHGTSHPTYVANWEEYSMLTVPARWASREPATTAQVDHPGAVGHRVCTSSAVSGWAGSGSRRPAPARLSGPMCS